MTQIKRIFTDSIGLIQLDPPNPRYRRSIFRQFIDTLDFEHNFLTVEMVK